MKLKLEIINLDGIYFQGDVDLLCVMTSAGELTILANHIPLITNIEISRLYYKNDGKIENFAISGGTLFVSESKCKVITMAIEKQDQIDLERANKSKERALERLAKKDENIDIKRAEVALKRALNRIKISKL